MNERIRENYFIIVRLIMLIVTCVCCVVTAFGEKTDLKLDKSGISVTIFLLVSLFMASDAIKELLPVKKKRLILIVSTVFAGGLIFFGGSSFLLLVVFNAYEIMCTFERLRAPWYILPVAIALLESPMSAMLRLVTAIFMCIVYMQHSYIVRDYRKRMMEDTVLEQGLKRDLKEQQYAAKEELKRNMLQAENQILEERASLSQTLHDKLGHNINGSVYQLEGAKVLMERDPEKAKSMIQAVIDQLRTGMDEIRLILRKERPKKKEFALLQLNKLCEESNERGVQTELFVEGDTGVLPDELWEVILDNAFEAVSNSMKYAKCKHISIKLIVMNKMIRCSIADDGVGCDSFDDGMGISGMRSRVRKAGGTLDFETNAGFCVTMLLPLKRYKDGED